MDKIATKQILEKLEVQDLTEEEKASRHILKRLVGPIATYTDSTRNGRLYNEALWNKQLNDDIFNEKIDNKCLFLELGHPLDDREELDMTKACACIPSLPKIVNGDLYGIIDVLDTPNGRLLNTYIDYGFVPGISSRGSGEINENNEVDPDSFCLETWDIVPVPAVKKARLSVCESLNQKTSKTLTEALHEVYENSTNEDKEVMKDALNNLNEDVLDDPSLVHVDELDDTYKGYKVKTIFVDDLINESVESEDSNMRIVEEKETEIEDELEDAAEVEDEDPEIDAEETKDEDKKDKDEDEPAEPKSEFTVKEIKDAFKGLDNDSIVTVQPVEFNGETLAINLTLDRTDEDNLIIGGSLAPVEDTEVEDNIDGELETDEFEPNEAELEADNAGSDEEVLENVKNLVRQNDLLEGKIKSLTKAKAVSDTKVKELEEDLAKFKSGFTRMSEIAAKANKFEKDNQALTERLKEANANNSKLAESLSQQKKLNLKLNSNIVESKSLKESLDNKSKKFEELKESTDKQIAQYSKKLSEAIEAEKKANAKLQLVLKKYIESKATMLGVRPSVITEKLDKKYSLNDIDAVCDEILTESTRFNAGNFGRIPLTSNESRKSPKKKAQDDYSDIDPLLLELAGLI